MANLLGREDGSGGEIPLHSGLQHPNLVILHHVLEDKQTVAMVMECCHGGDLFDAITVPGRGTQALPEKGARRACRDVLSALQYLHENGIAHRDIKCENVLLLHASPPTPIEWNCFKLCDFGFATRCPRGETPLRCMLGSPETVAPEVVHGIPYGGKADVWSTGVILFSMLVAASPFSSSSDRKTLSRVRQGAYSLSTPRWATVSEQAKDMVRTLMCFDQFERPEPAAALQHPWLQRPGED